MSDPICGNCGKPRSRHKAFGGGTAPSCGDWQFYSSEPSSRQLVSWLERECPVLIQEARRRWKIAHGHEVEPGN
jgi:hypothetical protein